MVATHDEGFDERLERAIRTTGRTDPAQEETPETFGRRVADELFTKAVESLEAKKRKR